MDDLLLQTPAQLTLHLKALRKLRGMTQADVARRIGLSQQRYTDIERNPARVSVAQLLRLLAILGTDVRLSPRPQATGEHNRRLVRDRLAHPGEDW